MTGRPLTEQAVRHALNHPDGVDALDLKLLCEDWLRLHRLVETQQEALKWYADADNYFDSYKDETQALILCPALEDEGRRARDALAPSDEEEK